MNAGSFERLTAAGPAAIACVAATGTAAADFARRHLRFRGRVAIETAAVGGVFRADFVDGEKLLDDVLVTVHATQPLLELRIHLHGGPWIVGRCAEFLSACGACESSAPHVLGVPDLIERELLRELPKMLTLDGARWLIRQARSLRAELHKIAGDIEAELSALPIQSPKTKIHGLEPARERLRALAQGYLRVRRYAEPLRVALVGAPNAGKSSLVNALAGDHVSIVSAVAGTTRDWVEAPSEVGGFPVVWLDTAGLRATEDSIEQAGIERTERLAATADLVVAVLDGEYADAASVRAGWVSAWQDRVILCWNKCDLRRPNDACIGESSLTVGQSILPVSAKTREGLDRLGMTILQRARVQVGMDSPGAISESQAKWLQDAARGGDAKILRNNLLQSF